MKRKKNLYLALALSACMVGCAPESVGEWTTDDGVILRTALVPFEGEPATRTTSDGLAFENGDGFRMKIICPHTSDHQTGESWGAGYYQFVIGGSGDVYLSGGQSAEAQATTYVYTAQNTTDTCAFVIDAVRYSRPTNRFRADQSKLKNFKRSDVVWAQSVRQTGAKEVHLHFHHKVAKLEFTLDDSELTHEVDGVTVAYPLSDKAVLTLEGMPDIDGAEIVVGDYYADQSYESERYNYREKASCNFANNGKVLGVAIHNETEKRSGIAGMTGNPSPGGINSKVYDTVENTGVYTAYQDPEDARHYRLYVPPCSLTSQAVCWVRDGERRYRAVLEVRDFVEGRSYPVRLKLKNPAVVIE